MKTLYCVIFVFSILLSGCSCRHSEKTKKTAPLNIVLLIGDGMGLQQISSVYYYGNDTPSFSLFPVVGIINTSSATHKITDSGAGGTAFSTGRRTYNGAIGVGTDSIPLKNIVEILSERGYKTGLVATSSITHATPAVFYAHVKSRKLEEDIAIQLIRSEIDFFAGSGIAFFNQRKDGLNLFDTFPSYNFIVDTMSLKHPENFDQNKKYGYLFYARKMPKATEKRGEFLSDASVSALNYLKKSPEGFFLMIEGSQIDWACHDNNTDDLIAEMLDFDRTIKKVLDFAKKDGNTLVIVLADHETGGYSLSSKASYTENENDYNLLSPSFSTKGHSASMVPVFAFGPGCELFSGVYNNTDVFYKILKSAGIVMKQD